MKKLKIVSLIVLALVAFLSINFAPESSGAVLAMTGIGVLPTPQQKLAYIAQKLGYTNLDDMQASQRTLFDTLPLLPLTGNTILNFFDQVGQRGFPLTNLADNKLAKGEAIVVQRISFGIILRNTAAPNDIVDVFPFSSNAAAATARTFKGLYASQMSLKIGSSEVIKKMSLVEMYGPFNKGAKFSNIALSTATAPAQLDKELSHDVIFLDSYPGITENNEFVVSLQIPPITTFTPPAGTAAFIFCKLEGIGAVFSPTTKY